MVRLLQLAVGSIVAVLMFGAMVAGSYLFVTGTDFAFFAVVAVFGGALAVIAGGAINYWTARR